MQVDIYDILACKRKVAHNTMQLGQPSSAICVCVCVCVCACACVRAFVCVCACVRVCLFFSGGGGEGGEGGSGKLERDCNGQGNIHITLYCNMSIKLAHITMKIWARLCLLMTIDWKNEWHILDASCCIDWGILKRIHIYLLTKDHYLSRFL